MSSESEVAIHRAVAPPLSRPLRQGGNDTHRNTKRTGELSEAAFLLKAETLGFHVSRPWGDSERYDFILDAGPRLWRVQLKCTEVLRARGYDIQPIYAIYGQGKVVYSAADIDALVVHIIPMDAWYVIPVEDFFPSKSLRFYPDVACKRARWEKYREAWDLLRSREPRQDAGTRTALEAAYRPECKDRDWRRRLLHIAGEILRGKQNPDI
jgi:PD-(D/E)XK endonuclease